MNVCMYYIVIEQQTILLSVISSTYALYASNSDVVQAGANNFKEEVLKHNGVVIVEFFAPWFENN